MRATWLAWCCSAVTLAAEPAPSDDGHEPQLEYPQTESPPSDGCRPATSRATKNQPPPLSRPANPWQAIKDDRPVPAAIRFNDSQAYVRGRQEVTSCDAQHDHCLRECSWLFEPYPNEATKALVGFGGLEFVNDPASPIQRGWMTTYRPDGTFAGEKIRRRAECDFIAYRTIPAVKRLLTPGIRVIGFTGSALSNEYEALSEDWRAGVVRKIDEDAGVLFIKRSTEPWPLATIRIPVLRYQKGGKVELMPGFTKDEITVRPDDVLFGVKK